MKHFFSPFLVLVLLIGANKTFAQNQQIITDPSRISGNFEISVQNESVTNHINVNYTLSPAPFTNVLNVSLNTPNPRFLSIDILNDANSVVLHWAPQVESISYTYKNAFDISALQPGNYHVNINDDKSSLLYTVPFTK